MEVVLGMPIGEFGDHVARYGKFVETLVEEARDCWLA